MKGSRGEGTIISSGMNQVEDTAVLFVRYTGWAIYPWINPNIFRRIGALQFSGIPAYLSSLQKEKTKWRSNLYSFNTTATKTDPEPLTINGNIMSIFVVGGVGLFGGCMIFLCELIQVLSIIERILWNSRKCGRKFLNLVNPTELILSFH